MTYYGYWGASDKFRKEIAESPVTMEERCACGVSVTVTITGPDPENRVLYTLGQWREDHARRCEIMAAAMEIERRNRWAAALEEGTERTNIKRLQAALVKCGLTHYAAKHAASHGIHQWGVNATVATLADKILSDDDIRIRGLGPHGMQQLRDVLTAACRPPKPQRHEHQEDGIRLTSPA